VTAASHQKNTNPKKEDSGAISFLSLATTAGRGEGNNIITPPTPEQTPQTPRHGRNSTVPGESTLPRSADLRGNQASSSPVPPQVALPRWGSSSSILIPTRRRLHHLDAVPEHHAKTRLGASRRSRGGAPAAATPPGLCPAAPPAAAAGGGVRWGLGLGRAGGWVKCRFS
jgi:hypothetical protein